MVAILSDQREAILAAVRDMYTQVASYPARVFHFPTGRDACRFVGYPETVLAPLPELATESFAGVGYPFAAEVIRPGDTVLDVGSGSGTDALVASRLTGTEGRVLGLDMTPAMQEKLVRSAAAAGAMNVHPLLGNTEEIPLPDSSADVVTSNGVLNLVPDKHRALVEIFRVLRPGGRVQIADIVLGRPVSGPCREDPRLWAECVVGATPEADYLRLFRSAGFLEVEVLGHLDYFSGSASAETREVAELFGGISLVLRARKPEEGEAVVEEPLMEEQLIEPPAAAVELERGAVRAHRLLDMGSRTCGEVTPRVRTELRDMAPGQVLGVLSDFARTEEELAAWCRLTGHAFLGSAEKSSARVYYIRRRED
ncbi:MAG: methyltransferase domain-containing protein [Gemmatimonadetes bacterium]|nr:methyltransferase domain-containing protein [Gemmatimonadota bacterium]